MNLNLAKKGHKLARIISAGNLQWFRAIIFGVAAGIEHRFILPNLDTLQTVVDVGASHGQFALVVRHCFPEANIFSFEPLSSPAARFRKVFHGDTRVTLHQVAIGPEPGQVTIHVSAEDDSSSLLPISVLQEKLYPGTGEVRTDTVKVRCLADFFSKNEIIAPALLKLDVQGYELEALRGCEDLLECFAFVYVECSFMELYIGQALAHDIIEWLAMHGFILTGLYNISYDKKGQAIQADFLFKKNPVNSN